MERKDNMPLWVFFGLSSINTRKGALILFWACFVCGIVFIPVSYHLDDWSWAGFTFLAALWYWLCIRWMDQHSAWQ